MLEWKEEVVIPANIEKVWNLFRDANIKRIMPKVEEHTLIEKTEEEVGAKHKQKYREGKRVETYIVETIVFEDEPSYKHKEIAFVLGKAFEVKLSFVFEKIEENNTKFIYAGHNKGVNFVGRAMLKLAGKKSNDSVVMEFLERVKNEVLKEQ